MAPVWEMKKETHPGDWKGTNESLGLSLSPTTRTQLPTTLSHQDTFFWSSILTLQSLPNPGSLPGARHLSSINGKQAPEF